VLLALGSVLSYTFFNSLKKKHAAYYKSIGEPIVSAHANFTSENYIQLMKGSAFLWLMTFRGIPKNFPKNENLRKLAQAIRIVSVFVFTLFITLVILGYFLYKASL
jgi:hypothetical protein